MGIFRLVGIWLCALALCYCSADAFRPANMSICDYYTTALLRDNTAANQKLVITLIVNTAIVGNYTKPNLLAVDGILKPGVYADPTTGQNTSVNLAPYFTGALASTNRGGTSGVSVNFLDDGGAAPLMKNLPASGTSSNQYRLLTHLYEYFGALLGCSMTGSTDFPAYAGADSQYEVHKFMDLSSAQMGYFITQVALAAASFGVAGADLQIVGTALSITFGMRCSPAVAVIPAQGAQLQSICTDSNTCPLASNGVCPNANISPPQNATASSTGISTTGIGIGISTTGTGLSATSTSSPFATGSPSVDSGPSAPNSLAIGLGVSLGVVVTICIAGGIWFLIRRQRRRNAAAVLSGTGGKSELEGTSAVRSQTSELEGTAQPSGSAVLGQIHESAGGRYELNALPEGKAELDGHGIGK